MANSQSDGPSNSQMHLIIKELEKLNKTMDSIAMNIGRYTDIMLRQPPRTNV